MTDNFIDDSINYKILIRELYFCFKTQGYKEETEFIKYMIPLTDLLMDKRII